MRCDFKMIYGGRLDYQVKDKKTGQKTEQKASMVNLLELTEDKSYVNSTPFNVDINFDTTELECLKPCIATLEISATSNFKKLVDLKPCK